MLRTRPAMILLVVLWGGVMADAATVPGERQVGSASAEGILAWTPKRFSGETRYRLERDAGRPAIRADSDSSASALIREIDIDLVATPFLRWSWRVGNLLHAADETQKDGDDYPARVYVLFRGGWMDPRPFSLSYVWSSSQPRGNIWPNAYTDRVIMVAAQGAEGPVGDWVDEQHNVREDIKRHFGKEVDTIKAVAIMTDTDNTGQRTTAWYGNISFVASESGLVSLPAATGRLSSNPD